MTTVSYVVEAVFVRGLVNSRAYIREILNAGLSSQHFIEEILLRETITKTVSTRCLFIENPFCCFIYVTPLRACVLKERINKLYFTLNKAFLINRKSEFFFKSLLPLPLLKNPVARAFRRRCCVYTRRQSELQCRAHLAPM